jgi:hypothetical protein
MRALLTRLAEATALHLTVEVDGARPTLSLVWQGRLAGSRGAVDLAIVAPPAPHAPVLVIRVPRGKWVLCLPAEAARKGLALAGDQAAAAAAGLTWRTALAAEQRANGERPGRR